ncbi:HD-GYP domain-containing protein [Ferdinandcohnia quinoae]|uniref:HD-GYP domain-containing protein n=1 Tax=Fredinandcohnia quinoae TaxID=2918902 RepID=A0AAW5E2G7_9BACI|nr:HD-GYP domain-containing protein [Fredinandcohnia sp. SECRCQ15]MCH1624171.1 HD-GYP domain-containing protein [Fredinandcohnia sp. SECRCQ15]
MSNRFFRWLNHPVYFQYGFYILSCICLFSNGLIPENESNYYILYIFCAIFFGIGFYNRSALFIIFVTFLIVLARFFLIPDPLSSYVAFLIYFFTYLLITFISVGLMKYAQKVKEDNVELTKALANALDSRDASTLHHSENVANYAVKIARKMKLPQDLCNVIRIGGLLHDIGKIGIPEFILKKPAKLTNEEYDIIKSHPVIGYEMINHISSFKENGVLDIVLYHHERYDGKGYPSGLKGDDIPLIARIVALADTFDAMSSKRVYRDELDLDNILTEIRKNKGSQFDPNIVDIFLSLFEQQK